MQPLPLHLWFQTRAYCAAKFLGPFFLHSLKIHQTSETPLHGISEGLCHHTNKMYTLLPSVPIPPSTPVAKLEEKGDWRWVTLSKAIYWGDTKKLSVLQGEAGSQIGPHSGWPEAPGTLLREESYTNQEGKACPVAPNRDLVSLESFALHPSQYSCVTSFDL